MTITTTRILSLAAGVALAAAALTGCTSPSDPTTDSTSQSGTEEQDRLRWESDLRACLSAQGFDLPEDGQVDFGSRQGEYELASQQCQDEVGPPPGADENISPEQRAAVAEGRAATDKCFRDAGFDEGIGDDPELYIEPEGVSAEVSEKCFAAGDRAMEKALDR